MFSTHKHIILLGDPFYINKDPRLTRIRQFRPDLCRGRVRQACIPMIFSSSYLTETYYRSSWTTFAPAPLLHQHHLNASACFKIKCLSDHHSLKPPPFTLVFRHQDCRGHLLQCLSLSIQQTDTAGRPDVRRLKMHEGFEFYPKLSLYFFYKTTSVTFVYKGVQGETV